MKQSVVKRSLGVFFLTILLVGGGVIMATTRPVADTGAADDSTATFTMDDVAAHNVVDDCWSAVEGAVYDLTSWVSRHPGGAGAIEGLCGIDGTDLYRSAHGNGGSPARALSLLKIGTLE